MKKSFDMTCFFAFLALLIGCSTPQAPVEKKAEISSSVEIEPQKGRINVETSLARSLKYNIKPLEQQIISKFMGEEAAQEAFTNLHKLRKGQAVSLAVSLKELDFAILYAAINKTSDSAQIESVLSQATAQNLALGTLKAHKYALFSHKQIFEINRKIRQYQKQITVLLKNKNPDDEIQEKKKTLEESIDNLNRMLAQLQQNQEDFRQLTKLDKPKFEIEGRSFFEKTALQPQTKAFDYQTAAIKHRLELTQTKPIPPEQIAKQFENQLIMEADRQSYFVQDSAYRQKLAILGDEQASSLVQTVLDYQKASRSKKEKLITKLEEELYKAVYLQLEIAYQLAQKTTADYEIQQENLHRIKQNLRSLEKISRPKPKQQIELLKEQIKLFENEMLADQILAERAITITALRFYSGQLIVLPETPSQDLAGLSAFWHQALSSKIVTELTVDPLLQKSAPSSPETGNGWAHKDNWLETLMEEKPTTTATPKLMSRTLDNRTENYDTKKVMQLGAFLDLMTAEKEWQKICADFPELKNKNPTYEKTEVTGIALYRLLLKSTTGGFKDICIRLRKKGYECFLRD